jgi:hypothetical protein
MRFGLHVPLTREDWDILFKSSLVGRKMWVLDVVENRDHENDVMLMLDLTIESEAERAIKRALTNE